MTFDSRVDRTADDRPGVAAHLRLPTAPQAAPSEATFSRAFAQFATANEFGGRNVRVTGPIKVMSHLMFGVLALSADQLMRLTL